MKTFSFILVNILISTFSFGQYYTIKGRILDHPLYDHLALIKHINPYEQVRLVEKQVQKGDFEFQISDKEIDMYVIQNSTNKNFIMFIWDGNLTVEIDSIDFWNSKVNNSKLTDEMDKFGVVTQKTFFDPIRKLDTLITNYKVNRGSKSVIDSLEKLKSKLIDESQKGFMAYNREYIRLHPDSFFSLYLLSKLSMFGIQDADRESFSYLSKELKNHSRAKQFKE